MTKYESTKQQLNNNDSTNEPIWDVPVTWQMWGVMKIRAKTLDKATKKAVENQPLPKDAYYVDDSCEVDYDSPHLKRAES